MDLLVTGSNKISFIEVYHVKNRKSKQTILSNNPELELCSNGDFRIKFDFIKQYEIIDFHCHLYEGLSELFPSFLQKEKENNNKSLMDMSCFPFSMDLFDLDQTYFTKSPKKLLSLDGIKTKVKLFTGAFVLKYATSKRLIKDMDNNSIKQAVVHQISALNGNCAEKMDELVKGNERLFTFGSIHPYDKDIPVKIKQYMSLDIKGWKLNPHVWGVPIDCSESIMLLKQLAQTGLPILSCSGTGLPEELLRTAIPSRKTKCDMHTQQLNQFYKVLDNIPDTTFILAHAGCFDFNEIIKLMQRYKNTYTDISVQPASNIKQLIEKVGSERILFGTDYPFVSQAFSILSVLRATSYETERQKIFSENAKKVLKI